MTPLLRYLTEKEVYLHSIQHRLDDTGDRCHVLLVLQVDAVQHHLVGPADEVGQALVHTVVAGGQRRTIREGRKNMIKEGDA